MAQVDGLLELSGAASFFLEPPTPSTDGGGGGGEAAVADPFAVLPHRWLAHLSSQRLEVLELRPGAWTVSMHVALLRLAAAHATEQKCALETVPPSTLPLVTRGPLAGICPAALHVRLGLLQLFNEALAAHMPYAFTGYAERPHTLGWQLCALRELIFPKVKTSAWTRALDATAPVRDAAWNKAHPS